MKALRTIFGKVFGRSTWDGRPTGPGGRSDSPVVAPPSGDTRLEELERRLLKNAKRPAPRSMYEKAGDGVHTRKSRDQRPPHVRFARRVYETRAYDAGVLFLAPKDNFIPGK